MVGLIEDGAKLLKVNLATKTSSTINLPVPNGIKCRELVVDDKSNLYAYKVEMSGAPEDFVAQLVKLDPAGGSETLLATLPTDDKIHDNIALVPQRNEFIATWGQKSLMRINASTYGQTFITLYTGFNKTYNYFTSN